MVDREKVIKGLEICIRVQDNEKCPDECPYRKDICYGTVGLMADALSLLKAQKPGWISVKDRLPDSNRFVLVCNDDGHMMIAQYIEETAQWQYKYINYDVDVWDDKEQGPVCWWTELPEPQKEE